MKTNDYFLLGKERIPSCDKCGMSARNMFYEITENEGVTHHQCKSKKPFTIDLVLFGILMFGAIFILIITFIVLGWYIFTLI